MNNKTYIDLGLNLSESEIISYYKKEDELTVTVKLRNDETADMTFTSVVGFIDNGTTGVTCLCRLNTNSPFCSQVFKRRAHELSDQRDYTLFQFLQEDDYPSMQVIAKTVAAY
ncbi:MAG: hypothetical protein GY754_43785 [bacterium]|nr:hypothetical protein [bacterium]